MKTDYEFLSCGPRAARLQRAAIACGASLLLLVWAASASAYPQGPEALDDGLWSADFILPSTLDATQWVEQFPGEWELPPMSPSDSFSDPFANSGDLHSGSPADADWLVPYDGVNTNETYSGDLLDSAPGSAHIGLDLGAVGGLSSLNPVDSYWADSSGSPVQQLPALGFAPVPAQSNVGPFHYAVVFANVTSGGSTAGEWFEVPYNSTNPVPNIMFTAGNTSETLSNVGFILSPTMIPLDNLNFGAEPPPGQPGSQFIPLPNYNGSAIGAGGSISIVLPEPNSLILAAMAALCTLFGYRRCRKAA